MSEDNKAVVRRFIDEVWNQKNPDRAENFIAPNYRVETPDGVLEGLQGWAQLYDTYVTAFPDARIDVTNVLAEGDQVAIHYTYTGTHRGPLQEIPPTGRQVDVQGILITRLANGKLVEDRIVWDTLALMQQIGAVPTRAAQKAQGA